MQIIQDAKTQLIVPTSDFKIKSNAIRFTDPCYSNDTWCKGSLPALNGTYHTRVGFFRDQCEEHEFQNTINLLKISHELIISPNILKEFKLYTELNSFIDVWNKDNGYNYNREYDQLTYPENLIPTKNYLVSKIKDLKCYSDWYTEKTTIMQNLSKLLQMIQLSHHSINERYSFEHEIKKLNLKKEGASEEDTILFEISYAKTSIEMNIQSHQKAYDEGHPKRTQFLHIKHESIPEFTSFDSDDWQYNSKFNVGVDSGQAGFFDEEWYTNEYDGDKDEDRSMYFAICDVAGDIDALKSDKVDKYRYRHSKEKINLEYGILTQTAYGDGSAPLYFRTNDKDEVIEAVYHYDANEEDEEDEE